MRSPPERWLAWVQEPARLDPVMHHMALWLYRTWSRLSLPKPFRAAYGADMEELFGETLEAATRRGWGYWLFGVMRGLWDITEQGVRIRRRSEQGSTGTTGLRG